jgi:hypothetical protein
MASELDDGEQCTSSHFEATFSLTFVQLDITDELRIPVDGSLSIEAYLEAWNDDGTVTRIITFFRYSHRAYACRRLRGV